MNVKRSALLGAFLVISLVTLTILSLYLRDFSLRPRTNWTVYFGGKSLVAEGIPVWSSGIKVGVVDRVEPVADEEFSLERQVRATVKIRKEITIWKDGALVIRPFGWLGGFRAELRRGTPAAGVLSSEEPLPSEVEGGITDQLSGLLRDNRAGLTRITSNVVEMTDSIMRGEGSMGAFIRDRRLYDDLTHAAKNLSEFSDRLNVKDSSLARFLEDKQLFGDVKRAVKALADIGEKINTGQGSMGRLINDDTLVRELERGISKLSKIASDIESGQGTIGLLLKDKAMADDVAKTVRGLRKFTEALNEGQGTLSQLLHSPAVYEDLRAVSSRMRDIMDDIHGGKGTLGKFLRNDSIYNELQRMLESFRESGDITRENAALASLTSFTSLFFNTLN